MSFRRLACQMGWAVAVAGRRIASPELLEALVQVSLGASFEVLFG